MNAVMAGLFLSLKADTVLKAWLRALPPMSAHYGENKGIPVMSRLIAIPIQTIIGLLLMGLIAIHFSMAVFWLFFIGLVLLGSIFGTKPAKRRTMQDSNPPT